MYEIYKITNLITKKVYIGQTSWPCKQRWVRHKSAARSGVNNYLYRSIRKHGEDNFIVECIEIVETKEEADSREKFWIIELKSIDRSFGYNLKDGGEGRKLPESIKNKISQTNKQRFIDNPSLRKEYGDRRRGYKFSPEFRQKLSKARKGKRPREIYVVSEEQKQKIRQSLRLYWATRKSISKDS